jgi:hypothetical protein
MATIASPNHDAASNTPLPGRTSSGNFSQHVAPRRVWLSGDVVAVEFEDVEDEEPDRHLPQQLGARSAVLRPPSLKTAERRRPALV